MSRVNLTSSGSGSYGYSSENLMVSAPGGVALDYDPLLRLYQVTSGSGTTRYLYDGVQMAGEYSSSGNLLERYVFAPGGDDPIAWYHGTGTSDRRFLASDARGSVIAVTDSAGAKIAINSYDEYGIPGSGNVGRFQYTGQAWLPEIGLYYYKTRMYSPTLGRFMQSDPIGYGDGMNWYNYVGSDPINGTDPSGLLCSGASGDDAATCRKNGGNWIPPDPDVVVYGPRNPFAGVSENSVNMECYSGDNAQDSSLKAGAIGELVYDFRE